MSQPRLGYELSVDDTEMNLDLNGEPFKVPVYESKDQVEHEPTKKELQEQKQRVRWREMHADWYRSDRNIEPMAIQAMESEITLIETEGR